MGLMEEISGKALKKYLGDIQNRAMVRKADISDHPAMLFTERLNIESNLIVGLGVGDGESTFVLARVANLWGVKPVSVDIDDRAEVSSFKDRILSNRTTYLLRCNFQAGAARGDGTRGRHFVY